MTATELLSKLRADGVTVEVDGSELIFKGKKSALTPEVIVSVSKLKTEIMEIFADHAQVCWCQPPMPMADIDRQPCQDCGVACWCPVCAGCRWCDLEIWWRHHLVAGWSMGDVQGRSQFPGVHNPALGAI